MTLQYIIQDEILKLKDLSFSGLSDDFSKNIIKEVEIISSKIKDNNFVCLGTVKPDYIDKNIIDITEEKNKKDLKKKILNLEDKNDINIYEASKNINMEELNNFL